MNFFLAVLVFGLGFVLEDIRIRSQSKRINFYAWIVAIIAVIAVGFAIGR